MSAHLGGWLRLHEPYEGSHALWGTVFLVAMCCFLCRLWLMTSFEMLLDHRVDDVTELVRRANRAALPALAGDACIVLAHVWTHHVVLGAIALIFVGLQTREHFRGTLLIGKRGLGEGLSSSQGRALFARARLAFGVSTLLFVHSAFCFVMSYAFIVVESNLLRHALGIASFL